MMKKSAAIKNPLYNFIFEPGHLRVKSKSPDRQRGGGIGSTLADAASGSPTRGSPTTLSGQRKKHFHTKQIIELIK